MRIPNAARESVQFIQLSISTATSWPGRSWVCRRSLATYYGELDFRCRAASKAAHSSRDGTVYTIPVRAAKGSPELIPFISSDIFFSGTICLFPAVTNQLGRISLRPEMDPTSIRVDLTASRAPKSPTSVFADLSAAAAELGVAAFDVYGDFAKDPTSSWLRAFESEVAADLGKEDAVFMPSGVMAQQIALAIHRDARATLPPRFVCHHTSHLLIHEASAHSHLLGMEALVAPAVLAAAIQAPLSSAEVRSLLLGDAETSLPQACAVVIELPHREIGGKCTPWEDVLAVASLCHETGAALHMDGTRDEEGEM